MSDAPTPCKTGVSIKDKVVLVTGANRGIGKCLVEAMVDHGASKVYAAVRSVEKAQFLVEKYGDKVVALHLDLSQPETIKAAAAVAKDVQVVVNNAGILSRTTALADDAVERLQDEMNVNVYGLLHLAQAFAASNLLCLCQVNSVGSLRCPNTKVSTYCASKAAAFSITQSLRLSMPSTLVVSVHPGPIDTDMIADLGEAFREEAGSPEEVAKDVIASIEKGEFLCFPDPKARSLSQAYQPFFEYVFEKGQYY